MRRAGKFEITDAFLRDILRFPIGTEFIAAEVNHDLSGYCSLALTVEHPDLPPVVDGGEPHAILPRWMQHDPITFEGWGVENANVWPQACKVGDIHVDVTKSEAANDEDLVTDTIAYGISESQAMIVAIRAAQEHYTRKHAFRVSVSRMTAVSEQGEAVESETLFELGRDLHLVT